ncbi:MAG TPA: penicillin-binding protein [Kofleriaceae bacterium]|nr:penicillin-binding protein [Kofleriaceae bacterium]
MKTKLRTPGVSPAARTRAWIATSLVTTLLCGVAYKAWGVQVADGARLREQAVRQHVHTVEIPAPRGPILDARGRPLAVSADVDSVFANPRAVVDVAGTAEKLATALELDVISLEARLASGKHFAWISRHISPEQANAVRALKLKGVEVTREPRRWYPGSTSGGPVLGFSGIDGNGLDGLELALDDVLTGERARFSALRDARGKTMMADGLVEATPGATVQLTVDRAIQHIADEALTGAITLHQAKSGTVVVLDVATGGVLAMASYPTYDPNDPAAAVKAQARNRPVTDVFEIGSVMKIFTVAAALDAGVTRPDEWWDVEGGRWKIGVKTVTDVHHEWQLTTSGIIKHSSNVGAVKIGLRLGRERLYEALRRFGFGSSTGIELPGEQNGLIRPGKTWREVELVTICYGYGLTVTPIQLAAAIAAVGNGGVYHAPRTVAKVTGADGTVLFELNEPGKAIMKPSTAAALIPMMASVFDTGKDGGTAKNVMVPGFKAGGKTGTAHKYDPAIRKYSPDKYLSSFAGLAPIDAPRIAVVVVVDEPRGGDYFGGKVAGPVFGKVASETLRYLGVPGDPTAFEKSPSLPDDEPLAPSVPPTTPDEDETPQLPDLSPDDSGAVIDVPDFRGMSIGRALDAARERGLEVVVQGSGRCAEQTPAAGHAAAGTVITLRFSDG